MSAMPNPRGRAAPGDRERPSLSIGADPEPDYWAPVPLRQLRRKDLTPRAKVVLMGVCAHGRQSRTWFPGSIPGLMDATGFSEKLVRQGLAELVEKGVIEWDSIGEQFRVLFRLRGPGESASVPSAPSPRIAAKPAPVPIPNGIQMESKRAESPAPHTPVFVLENLERENRQTDRPACEGDRESRSVGQSDFSLVRTEGAEEEQPPEQQECPMIHVPTESPPADPIERAAGVLGTVVPSLFAELLARHGEGKVEMALREVEGMSRPPRKPWGYFVGILETWEEEGTVVRVPTPRTAAVPASFTPREYMQNYNPGAPIEPLSRPSPDELAESIRKARGGDGPMCARMFRAMLRGLVKTGVIPEADVPADILSDPTPVKTPAAGSHANVPPPPAAEISDVAPVESYRPIEGATSPTGEHQTPQTPARCATPPYPAFPASSAHPAAVSGPERAGKGVNPASQNFPPGAPGGGRGEVCSPMSDVPPTLSVPRPSPPGAAAPAGGRDPSARRHDGAPAGGPSLPAPAQRARVDSNHQPSDSKDGGLPIDTSASIDPSGGSHPPGVPPPRFPHPSSDGPSYAPGKPLGRWKREADSFHGGAGVCGACRVLRDRAARPEPQTRELTAEDVAELRARVAAARRLKAARCGETIEDGEIEAAIGGGEGDRGR